MIAIEQLLQDFGRRIQPHEAYFVTQGRVFAERARQPDFLPGLAAVYEIDERLRRARVAAQEVAADAFHAIALTRRDRGFEPKHLGPLVEWAAVELSLNCVSSFAGFALLFHALAGPAALPFAPMIYAGACQHPTKFRPALLTAQALTEMRELREALSFQSAVPELAAA